MKQKAEVKRLDSEAVSITLEKLAEIAPGTLLLKLAKFSISETGEDYRCIYSGYPLVVTAN